MAAFDIALNQLRPSLVAEAIDAMRDTGISLYIHGAPGISKSAVARQIADKNHCAVADVRLSQMAPEDMRGVPMVGEIDGMKGLMWTPPLIFPRDLDYQQTEVITGSKTIRFFNPIGNNGIHYCTKPVIKVMSNDFNKQVEIVDSQLDRFTVFVKDYQGEPSTATIVWTVTGKVVVMFVLEEFNSAPLAVMAAAYQLILDRRIGDYVVPEGVMLIAMGNRDGDRGVTFKIPKPVANRFVHLEMIVNIDDWLDWGFEHGIHPDVAGFLARWPSKLLDFQPESPQYSFATPRSWEFVSKIISQSEMKKEVLNSLVCGAIGPAVGTEFLLHQQFMADAPDAKCILDGTTTTFRPKNHQHATQIAYSTAVQLIYLLKERNDEIKSNKEDRKNWYQQADRAVGFMLEFFTPEVNVVAMRMAMLTHKLRFSSEHMPRYVEFTKSHRDLFFG